MGKLLVYLKDYKKESVLGPLFKLLEASFELIVPLVMAAIIDHGVADGDKPYIMKMCLMLILLAIIGLVCAITAQYFSAKAAVGAATEPEVFAYTVWYLFRSRFFICSVVIFRSIYGGSGKDWNACPSTFRLPVRRTERGTILRRASR